MRAAEQYSRDLEAGARPSGSGLFFLVGVALLSPRAHTPYEDLASLCCFTERAQAPWCSSGLWAREVGRGRPVPSPPYPEEEVLAVQGCGQADRAAQPSSADASGASSHHRTPGWTLVAGEDDSEDVGGRGAWASLIPGPLQWGMEVALESEVPVSDAIPRQH